MDANFNIPPMLNPALDKLPGAPAVRRRFSSSPSNGSTFTPDSTIQIYLPTGAASTVIDPSRSYLRFNLNNPSPTSAFTEPNFIGGGQHWYTHSLPPGLTQGVGCIFWLDPSIGGQNLLREFRVYQSGVPQEQMTNYDNINTLLAETEFGDSIKSGLALQMWGAGGDYYPNFGGSGLTNGLQFDRDGTNLSSEICVLLPDPVVPDTNLCANLTLQPTQCPSWQMQSGTTRLHASGELEANYTNGVLGGRTSAPFWERNIMVPSTGDITRWREPKSILAVPTTDVGSHGNNILKADSAATSNYVTICMPLTSGIIGVQATKYLPSMLLASQSFYIEIKLGDLTGSIGNALNMNPCVYFGANKSSYSMNAAMNYVWGAVSEGNLLDYPWTIDNVQYVGEEIILTPELTNSLFSMAARHPIRWTTTSYRDYALQNKFENASQSFDQIIPSTLQSVSGIMHTFRNAATLTNFNYRRNYRLNPSITSWQYRIGAEFFPQKALQQTNIVDMYVHPATQLHATESAIEFNKMKHRMTGQGSNYVDGFSDNTAWNAGCNSTQWKCLQPGLVAGTAIVQAMFPLTYGAASKGDTTEIWTKEFSTTTSRFNWWADWSQQSLLGSFLIGWDMDVYGGVRGDTRDGRSFQSDQINVMFTSGIGSKGLDTGNKDIRPGLGVGTTQLSPDEVYSEMTCMHNVICKYDMVVTINPEGTMEVAF